VKKVKTIGDDSDEGDSKPHANPFVKKGFQTMKPAKKTPAPNTKQIYTKYKPDPKPESFITQKLKTKFNKGKMGDSSDDETPSGKFEAEASFPKKKE
jgi:hypothetical protein